MVEAAAASVATVPSGPAVGTVSRSGSGRVSSSGTDAATVASTAPWLTAGTANEALARVSTPPGAARPVAPVAPAATGAVALTTGVPTAAPVADDHPAGRPRQRGLGRPPRRRPGTRRRRRSRRGPRGRPHAGPYPGHSPLQRRELRRRVLPGRLDAPPLRGGKAASPGRQVVAPGGAGRLPRPRRQQRHHQPGPDQPPRPPHARSSIARSPLSLRIGGLPGVLSSRPRPPLMRRRMPTPAVAPRRGSRGAGARS